MIGLALSGAVLALMGLCSCLSASNRDTESSPNKCIGNLKKVCPGVVQPIKHHTKLTVSMEFVGRC